MINIADTRDLSIIEDLWYNKLKDYLYTEDIRSLSKFKRIKDSINDFRIKGSGKKKRKLKKEDHDLALKILNSYNSNLEKIIRANKDCLLKIANDYEDSVSEAPDCHSFLKEVFKDLYTDFTNKHAYNILEKLNIRTCSYCNRQYIFTNSGSFKVRPEFDHFFNKSRYPILAVSFYNLIPSCHTCNHGKGTKDININPYFDRFKCNFELRNETGQKMSPADILNIKANSKISINFSNPSAQELSNIENLGLSELYSKHDDYIKDLIEKAIAYNKTYSMGLISTFQGAGYNPQNVHDFIWGKYLDLAKLEQQPLSKLTRDLLILLKVIKE